ncbi:MAG: NAD-dependent dehydratase [Gemmatimonadetes bacterium]|nr:NAD-dependent dehydratase [Gemmatimonadota bacterium]
MPNRKKIVLTGASGTIAGLVLPALRERYDLVPLDIRGENRHGEKIPDIQIADLSADDRDAYRTHFAGADAIVHMAFVGSPNPQQGFKPELANVAMAYNVYQTALEEDIGRVVVASSNHAADYYEPLILDGAYDTVDPDGRALSDNYYGWAKEAYEHLGFVFAVGKVQGRPLPNVQIRIGGPRETDVERCAPGDLTCVRRALGAYISQRDLSQLVIKSIEAEDIRDERGVPFQIFYGISGNDHAFWSIVNARKVIGYTPEDNSAIRFADQIAAHMRASQGDAS